MTTKLRRTQILDGLPVYDATESLVIEIVKSDIRQKDRRDPEKCALARACNRELHVEAKKRQTFRHVEGVRAHSPLNGGAIERGE